MLRLVRQNPSINEEFTEIIKKLLRTYENATKKKKLHIKFVGHYMFCIRHLNKWPSDRN